MLIHLPLMWSLFCWLHQKRNDQFASWHSKTELLTDATIGRNTQHVVHCRSEHCLCHLAGFNRRFHRCRSIAQCGRTVLCYHRLGERARETDPETERQRGRKREREREGGDRETETDRQTDRVQEKRNLGDRVFNCLRLNWLAYLVAARLKFNTPVLQPTDRSDLKNTTSRRHRTSLAKTCDKKHLSTTETVSTSLDLQLGDVLNSEGVCTGVGVFVVWTWVECLGALDLKGYFTAATL